MNNISDNTIQNSRINSNNINISKRNNIIGLCLSITSLILSIASFVTIIAVKVNYNLEVISLLSIIGFIGILATFVVVSNFSQVNRIEGKMELKISELNNVVTQLLATSEEVRQIQIEIEKINNKITKGKEKAIATEEQINGIAKSLQATQKFAEPIQAMQKFIEPMQKVHDRISSIESSIKHIEKKLNIAT